MKYFTDSPFERLMMETPCGQSRAADAAWRREEQKEKRHIRAGAAAKAVAPASHSKQRKDEKK